MSYSIKQLSDIAGISKRTLRWYEQQGLLEPIREHNGYRKYGSDEVKRLQQILLYRELGFELKDMPELLDKNGIGLLEKLKWQLGALKKRKDHIEALIKNVEATIKAEEKGLTMKDEERFKAFKQKTLEENEQKYGKEIREKYGEDQVKASNEKFKALTKVQHEELELLNKDIATTLKAAVQTGDVESELAKQVVEMHKSWLMFYWPSYSPEQHRGVTQMYVEDERFKKYYEDIVEGGAQFLRDAVWAWTALD